MARKGAYRQDFANSARAALEKFFRRSGTSLTQRQIAQMLETSQATISKVRSGTMQMQMPLAVALSAALGVTLDDIFRREGEPTLRPATPDEIAAAIISAQRGSRITKTPRGGRG